MSIVNAILPPWSIVPLPKYMRDEFARRQKFGKKYADTPAEYVGPRFTWIRCISNAIIESPAKLAPTGKREGFIFKNEGGFKENYGMNDERQNIIGYDAFGKPHYIDNKLSIMPHRPNPGIIGIDVTVEKSIYRKAMIKWKCYSVDQLEYVGKYFFAIYNTVVLEWGWNNFDTKSLLPIFEKGSVAVRKGLDITTPGKGIKGVFSDPTIMENSILDSNGNCDSMIGHIIKWDYSFDQSDSSFNCTTEIASNSRIYLGLSLLNLTGKPTEQDKSQENIKQYFKSKFKQEILKSVTAAIPRDEGPNFGAQFNKATGLPPEVIRPPPPPGFFDNIEPLRPSIAQLNDPTPPPVLNKIDLSTALDSAPFGSSKATYKLESNNNIDTNGKVFALRKYIREEVGGNSIHHADLVYITFGLLCEILNDIIIPKIGSGHISKIDISESVIGGHVNMISTDKDIYLIPNKFSPYFNISDFFDDSDIFTTKDLNSVYAEKQLKKTSDNPPKTVKESDVLMKTVLNNYGARQDLAEILLFDKDGSTKTLQENCFPRINSVDDHAAGYYGYIKDIFINVDHIVKIMESGTNTTLASTLKSICDSLTDCNPWWKLQVQPSPSNGDITIIDDNYSNFEYMKAIKSVPLINLSEKDSAVYFFDAYNSNSVMKEFKLDVRISDAVASSVVNQINSDLSGGGGSESNYNHKSFFTGGKTIIAGSFDRIIDGEIASVKTKKKDRTAIVTDRFNKLNQLVTSLDEDCLTISKTSALDVKKKFEAAAKKADGWFDEMTVEDYKTDILTDPEKVKDLFGVRDVARLSLPKRFSYLNQRLTFGSNEKFTNGTNIPIPGAEVQFTVEGLGGFKTFQVFGIKDLPEPYKDKVIFKIKEVKHTVSIDGWNTTIIAAIIPVKDMSKIV